MTNIINEANRPIVTKLKWHQKLMLFLKKNTGTFIVYLVRSLNRVDLRLTKYILNPNHMKLEDLGPTSNATKNESYEQSLYWALRNGNVTNIALTGPYGSGKSSVIATFQAKQQQYNYLNISLATFDKEFKSDPDWRQKVELSILQQLIYHVKNRELPDSRFKKINHTTKYEMVLITLGLVLLGVCFFNIYKPEFVEKFSWWQHLKQSAKDWINYLSLGYFLLGVSTIIYKFYRTLKGFRFSKLGLTNGQLELADKEDKSIFNKHLDEIIYFFQVTSYDVIVIEDLDRFDDAEIFTKLREVNNLINNSRQVGRPVNFVYAVRDDMFKDTDRAKFFDMIIPIIPIINTSNSGDELNRKLDTMALEKPILESFFNTVTLYILDMRLLINIINEFKIYLTQIGKGLNPEKLLAIVIYKNLYPDEFAKLHKQDGDVYKFINTKNGFIKTHTKRIDREITAAEKIINDLNQVRLQNIQELKSVYITAIFTQLPNNSVLRINGVDASIATLLKDEYFDKLAIQSNFPYRFFRGNNYTFENDILQKSFAQVEQTVHSDSYQIRKAKLMSIADNEIQTQRILIKDNNRKKAEILGYNIKQVMNSFPDFVLPDEFNAKPLLAFFIGEGYIDEHYPMYISYFIQGSLSQGDMDFVQSLAQRKALGFKHQLTNVNTIVTKWLSIGNYEQPEILNITFFDWILKSDDREAEPRILFEQLTSGDERAMQFIDDYIENGQELQKFLSKLAMHYPNYWDKLFDDIRLDDSLLDKYICLLLENVPADLLINFNGSRKLTNYLDKLDYVEVFEKINNKQNIIDTLARLDIIFLHIEQTDSIAAIFEDIYENNRYHLTPENLKVIFKAFPDLFRPATTDDLVVNQYTIIKGSRASALFGYISNEINIYVKDVLLKIPTNTRESEQSVVELLANAEIEDAIKEQFIIQQQIVLPSIIAVDSNYWDWLLKYSKLKLTWNNLLDYYHMFESVTDTLIIYLNAQQEGKLLKDTWYSFFAIDEDKEVAAKLEVDLLNESKFRLDLYKEIADQSFNRYDDLNIQGLDELKVKALIDSGTFYFTEKSLTLINTYFPSLVLPFIFDNEEEYFKLDWPLSPVQYIALIESHDITTDQKSIYLKRLKPEDLTADLAFSLGRFLSANTAGISNFSMEFRVALFARQPSLMEIAKLLNSLGRYLTSDKLLQLVALLPKPYSDLAAIQSKPMFFEWNDLNENLLGYLGIHLTSVISTVNPDEKKGRFRVNFKREK